MSDIYIPVAYQDDLSGRKIVAKIKGTEEYVLASPPEYGLKDALRGEWVLESSLARGGFVLFETPQKEMTDLKEASGPT